MINNGGLNVKTVIVFLRRLLMSTKKKVFLILDNLRVHHAKKVKEWLKKQNNKIELFFLPSYSPEYNPDEYINKDLKLEMSKKPRARSEKELKNEASCYLSFLQKRKNKVANFFKHKKVLYAA